MKSKLPIDTLPDCLLEVIFSYFNLQDLRTSILVCKRWSQIINGDEDNEIWRVQCLQKLSDETLKSDVLASVTTFKSILR